MSEKSAGLYRNPISYVGGLIAAGSALLIIGTVLVGFSLKQPSPYLGIWTYMIFPGFLVMGLALFFFGMVWESRPAAQSRNGGSPPLPAPRPERPAPAPALRLLPRGRLHRDDAARLRRV